MAWLFTCGYEVYVLMVSIKYGILSICMPLESIFLAQHINSQVPELLKKIHEPVPAIVRNAEQSVEKLPNVYVLPDTARITPSEIVPESIRVGNGIVILDLQDKDYGPYCTNIPVVYYNGKLYLMIVEHCIPEKIAWKKPISNSQRQDSMAEVVFLAPVESKAIPSSVSAHVPMLKESLFARVKVGDRVFIPQGTPRSIREGKVVGIGRFGVVLSFDFKLTTDHTFNGIVSGDSGSVALVIRPDKTLGIVGFLTGPNGIEGYIDRATGKPFKPGTYTQGDNIGQQLADTNPTLTKDEIIKNEYQINRNLFEGGYADNITVITSPVKYKDPTTERNYYK